MDKKGHSRRASAINKQIYGDLFPQNFSKSDRRRMEILLSTIGSYADLSYDRVSLDDIANRAKTSARLVRHYFPEKDELFELTMKLIRGRYQILVIEALKNAKGPREQFEEYIRSAVSWPISLPEHVRAWFFFYLVCAQSAKHRKVHEELADIGEERIRALIKAAFPKNRLSNDDLHYFAKTVQRLITGALIEFCSERVNGDMRKTQDSIVRASMAVFDSLVS